MRIPRHWFTRAIVVWLGVLSVLAGAAINAVAAVATPTAGATFPDRHVRTRWADAPRLADGTVQITGAVQLVGATWERGARFPVGTRVMVRVQALDGTWSDWTALTPGDVFADPQSSEGRATVPSAEPIWFGEGGAVQLTAVGALPRGFTITTTYSGPRAADTRVAPRPAPAPAAVYPLTAVLPSYYTRADWGVDESQRDTTCLRFNPQVRAVFVHHTAGTNNYTADQVPAILRGIHKYHTSNGWCDIAYNALIDKFGRIWEGRYGGLDKYVRSGATGGFNSASWAISLMGDYMTTSVTSAMYTALRDVTAYKVMQIGADPFDRAELTQDPGGESVNARWKDGDVVSLNVISGHRDAVLTDCPGTSAYALLPALRRDVELRMQASPRGNVDLLTSGFNSIRVAGWAFDPETADPWYIWIDVDGRGAIAYADRARPDVGAYFPGAGDRHGFDVTVPAAAGVHRVCVSGMNFRAGHARLIACGQTSVSGSPIGNFEAVDTATPGMMTLTGWALDPESTGHIYLWIDVAGKGILGAADRARPDVGLAFEAMGDNHGFTVKVARPAGGYPVCVHAMNVGLGTDTLIGCRWAQVR